MRKTGSDRTKPLSDHQSQTFSIRETTSQAWRTGIDVLGAFPLVSWPSIADHEVTAWVVSHVADFRSE